MTTRFNVQRQMWTGKIALRMMVEEFGKRSFAEPMILTTRPPGEIVEPFVSVETEEAQELMDELWNAGLRPSEGSGSAGSLAATERHLADMKTIAFHALKVKP